MIPKVFEGRYSKTRKIVRIWDHGMWRHGLHPERCTCIWCTKYPDETLITIGKGNDMNDEVKDNVGLVDRDASVLVDNLKKEKNILETELKEDLEEIKQKVM